ncbi:hypothetical protein [Mucilaginibacter psychrotolerans]|uniref:O-antigen ligase domain-containing protein n=1 Tax=Mucilaginibacter psychrotolerans TaxID=1524096 RepID=A0A4Y8SIA4_9SPHI|nr:hypothetical protein [Mucilaginibacter psychrotolerans]TFF38813.1 hypothetical protein E2R66_07345 [Mucilaginibacter psychrotolerans]
MSTSPDNNIAVVTLDSAQKFQSRVDHEAIVASLKKGIWVYFILLIFEGSLRKWVLPQLATPLLVVRDPVAIWLLFTAWRNGYMPSSNYLNMIGFIGIFAFFTAILVGHHSLVVAVYGTRILLFHFPLIFLIGKIFDKDDVVKIGKIVLWMAIPMFFLILIQFYSPQSAFVNKGIGADSQGGGFSGALGYFRPPGTFSFTTGNTQFFSFVAVFIIYFWLSIGENINRILLISATAALISAIPISLSRGLLIQVVLTGLFALASVSGTPKILGRMLATIIGLAIILALLSNLQFFNNAINVLSARFDTAKESEGTINNTIINRMGASVLEPFVNSDLPFFGFGIGMGTNAGAKLLTGRSDGFLISEGEWGRMIGEMGAIFGIAAIVARMMLSMKILLQAYKRLRFTNILPWLMVSVSFQAVAQGQWAQPTALGFGVIMAGLTIAAMKVPAPRQVQ